MEDQVLLQPMVILSDVLVCVGRLQCNWTSMLNLFCCEAKSKTFKAFKEMLYIGQQINFFNCFSRVKYCCMDLLISHKKIVDRQYLLSEMKLEKEQEILLYFQWCYFIKLMSHRNSHVCTLLPTITSFFSYN